MKQYFQELFSPKLWRLDFNIQRQRVLNLFILVVLVFNIALAVSNELAGHFIGGKNTFLIHAASVIIIIVLIVLWWLNHKRYQTSVSLAFLSTLVVEITYLFSFPLLNDMLIFLGLIIFVSAFMVSPWHSYFLAILTTITYTISYLLTASDQQFNYISVITFYAISFFAYQIAKRLHIAMHEAGANEIRYLALMNENPAFVYIIEDGHNGRWLYANPQITQLLGYQPQEWCSQPGIWEKSLHPEDKERVLAEEEHSQKNQIPFHAEYRLLTRDERIVWVSDDAAGVSDAKTNNRYQGVMLNITARKRAEQIREATYAISQAAYSTENLYDLYAFIHKVISTLMRAENFFIALYDNGREICSFPYFVDEFDPPPSPRPIKLSLTDYVLNTGQPLFASPQVFSKLEKQGKVITTGTPSIDWLGVPLKVKERTIGAMVVQSYHEGERFDQEDLEILTFVSTQVANAIERKRAEETIRLALDEKEVLLREVHHRVKNNLQVIMGLLSMQADTVSDPVAQAIFNDTRARISSMALVHQELYQSDDLARVNVAEYFQLIANNLIYFFSSAHVQVIVQVEEVLMGVDKAIPCGLILNELISNAMKYAFPSGQPGYVWVTLNQKITADQKWEYHLSISDNGIGLPPNINPLAPETVGLQIVNILVKQLKGTLTVHNENGAIFEIRFSD